MSIWRTSPQAVSFKRALPCALTSTKTVSKLCGLLVHPSCMLICGYRNGATHRPNLSCVPKNVRSDTVERFLSFTSHRGQATIGHTEQLFMCYFDGETSKTVSQKHPASSVYFPSL